MNDIKISLKRRFNLLIVLLVCLCTSCTAPVAGWWAHVFVGPDDVFPKYEIPKKKTALIFVEESPHLYGRSDIADVLSLRLKNDLMKNEVFVKVVAPVQLRQRLAEPRYKKMSVRDIGAEFNVDYVLKVKIADFSLGDAENESVYKGRLASKVTLIDVRKKKIAWPTDTIDGHTMPSIVKPWHSNHSKRHIDSLTRKLAWDLSDKIAKLFYTHQRSSHVEIVREEE